jgi:hypothetical protein
MCSFSRLRVAVGRAYRQWALDRDQVPAAGFPIAQFLLIHTLSHMLMRQVALECGYSSASLRERIYRGTPSSPASGVLISTAASDSEGTLGGLVALGERRYLERIIWARASLRDHEVAPHPEAGAPRFLLLSR